MPPVPPVYIIEGIKKGGPSDMFERANKRINETGAEIKSEADKMPRLYKTVIPAIVLLLLAGSQVAFWQVSARCVGLEKRLAVVEKKLSSQPLVNNQAGN
jgi:hypothetical protein